jgi:hypothetical protein
MTEIDPHTLGPCCNCGTTVGVTNIMMLDLRAPTPGKGWGCAVCNLPADGAVAVLCDACLEQPLKTVCDGYPKEGKRVPVDTLSDEPFAHDMEKHREDDGL